MALPIQGPAPDCQLCPRLVRFRTTNREKFPDWHNGPVAAFGEEDAVVLIVGLAPGLRGANCTGRPFTGDFAGDLLYATLLKYGLAEGAFGARADDGFRLVRCRVTNAVRCVPPKNRPIGVETAACRQFLTEEITGLARLEVIVALGVLAHGAVLAAVGLRKSAMPFRHGALHPLPDGRILADSYHCSRYNTNTGRLTEAMFHAVFATIAEKLPPA